MAEFWLGCCIGSGGLGGAGGFGESEDEVNEGQGAQIMVLSPR